jgi:hypothetical protein
LTSGVAGSGVPGCTSIAPRHSKLRESPSSRRTTPALGLPALGVAASNSASRSLTGAALRAELMPAQLLARPYSSEARPHASSRDRVDGRCDESGILPPRCPTSTRRPTWWRSGMRRSTHQLRSCASITTRTRSGTSLVRMPTQQSTVESRRQRSTTKGGSTRPPMLHPATRERAGLQSWRVRRLPGDPPPRVTPRARPVVGESSKPSAWTNTSRAR